MKSDLIVPVDSVNEELIYIETMYCPNCKELGKCKPKRHLSYDEEGYQYDYFKIECNKCFMLFVLKFFVTSSLKNRSQDQFKRYNQLLKQLQKNNLFNS